jgi:hypothetical protein
MPDGPIVHAPALNRSPKLGELVQENGKRPQTNSAMNIPVPLNFQCNDRSGAIQPSMLVTYLFVVVGM